MLTFYYAPGTCALASHLALEFAGAPYEAKRLDFKQNQQRSPEYLRVNPKGRVPALVTERGVLTETPVLLQYIAQAFPQAKLAPVNDAFLLAKGNEFNSYLCSTVHVNHAHKGRGYRWVEADDSASLEAMKKKVPQTMAESFALIEEQMLKGPWVLGESFSTSDLYLYTLTRWLEGDGVDVKRFPKVADHMRRMEALPQVQKVVALHQ
ncbi:glutathione S-transferase family protein [Ramlibacter montanisoli]|uniref:Glutathione S-transferase family protein n=1 Tax=Ramlibacter montanisoli TaxID=2732512 RepID=A0A849KA45_9BURK|nr:glutathione S-transferase family protein [Ramlibacter montanisoli]NNU45212.1 glutathione S-transferase family protein [Ramlibacter montanisoli]